MRGVSEVAAARCTSNAKVLGSGVLGDTLAAAVDQPTGSPRAGTATRFPPPDIALQKLLADTEAELARVNGLWQRRLEDAQAEWARQAADMEAAWEKRSSGVLRNTEARLQDDAHEWERRLRDCEAGWRAKLAECEASWGERLTCEGVSIMQCMP